MSESDYLYQWAAEQKDYVESFHGESLNSGSMERLNRLKELCADFAAEDGRVSYENSLVRPTERNASVKLILPYIRVFSDRARELLAQIIAAADDVIFSDNGDGIAVSLGIRDLWDDYEHIGYDEDE